MAVKTLVDTDSVQTLTNKTLIASDLTVTSTGSTTARALSTRFAEVVNVKDYGAVGDGVTNDTVAIQAAINSLGVLGGTAWFPPGTYLTNARIVLTRHVSLAGIAKINTFTSFPNGNACAIIKATVADDVFYYDHGATPVDANIGIYDLGIDGNSIATNGIHYGLHRGVRFQRLMIKSCTVNGVFLDDSGSNSYTSDFEDVYVNMAASTSTACVRIQTQWAKISRLVTDGGGYGLILSGGNGTVTQCHLEGAGTAGIEITSRANRVLGSVIAMTKTGNANQLGISIPNLSPYDSNVIVGNRLQGTTATRSNGVWCAGLNAKRNIISGNQFLGFDTGIDNDGDNNILVDNVLDCITFGIDQSGDSNAIVGGYITLSSGSIAVRNTGSATTNTASGVITTHSYSGIAPDGKTLVALGGGAAPTLGTIGGSGPATAAQNTWMKLVDTAGVTCWVPVWK